MKDTDQYFSHQQEPDKSCLLAMRALILGFRQNVTEVWRYKMPFYCIDRKRFCYLWVHKKLKQPYLGIVDGNKIHHPDLVRGNRSRMKILLIDAHKNIPVGKIKAILSEAVAAAQEASSKKTAILRD